MKNLSYEFLQYNYESWRYFIVHQYLPISEAIKAINFYSDLNLSMRYDDYHCEYFSHYIFDLNLKLITSKNNETKINKNLLLKFPPNKCFYLNSKIIRGYYICKNKLVFCTLPTIKTLLNSALKDDSSTIKKFQLCYNISIIDAIKMIKALMQITDVKKEF